MATGVFPAPQHRPSHPDHPDAHRHPEGTGHRARAPGLPGRRRQPGGPPAGRPALQAASHQGTEGIDRHPPTLPASGLPAILVS